jgi:beta-mannosidase
MVSGDPRSEDTCPERPKEGIVTQVRDLELDGAWRLARYEGPDDRLDLSGLDWTGATVPGAVHYDLLRAGRLANPFASSAAALDSHWVARSDWVYRTTFALDGADLGHRIAVEFDGVDTFSAIWLNGTLIGNTANAYRAYRFDVPAGALHAGENELVVHVKGHHRMIEDKIAEAKARLNHPDGVEGLLGKSLIRRYQRNFFTNSSLLNLGTGVLGIGVYKPVRVVVRPEVEIADTHLTLGALDVHKASVWVEATLDRAPGAPESLTVHATLTDPATGQTVEASVPVNGDRAGFGLTVADPKLWWPRGYGDPFLYHLTVSVRHGDQVLATRERSAGLRRIELVRHDERGKPTFYFRVNGQRVHVRGANLIPVDYIKVHGEWAEYERLLRFIENGNGNLIRMWGGGAVEDERFYDACDERGIMLWQDFYLHSNLYPDYDEEFVAEFERESAELLRRIRGHACLTLLCGGNEQREGWDEWQWKDKADRFYGERLVTEVLPAIAAELCPELPYIDNSPHGGAWSQSPVAGEGHVWGNFFNAHKDPQFVTETCWGQESYSRPETLREVMDLDVDELSGLGWPEKWTQLTKLPIFTKFPYTSYHNTGGLRGYLRGLELEQAYADYHAMSMFRLRSSSCSGFVYWSLNKGGPLFQFGCIDYGGRPMVSYYVLSRLYADLLVGVYRDIDDIRVVASNLSTEAVQAQVRVRHLHVDGRVLGEWDTDVTLEPGGTTRVRDLVGHYPEVVDRTSEVVHAQLVVGGAVVSTDMLLFCPVAEVIAPAGAVSAEVVRDRAGWQLQVRGNAVSKMVEIEGNGRFLFSDNYFPLAPGEVKRIRVELLDEVGVEKPALTVTSLDAPGELTLPLE